MFHFRAFYFRIAFYRKAPRGRVERVVRPASALLTETLNTPERIVLTAEHDDLGRPAAGFRLFDCSQQLAHPILPALTAQAGARRLAVRARTIPPAHHLGQRLDPDDLGPLNPARDDDLVALRGGRQPP